MYWKPDADLYPRHLRPRIRRGCGVGDGFSYRPWFKTRDVPSCGTSSGVLGILTKRPHHLLSELEITYFYLMERRKTTVGLREQWPILDFDRTLELCAEFGVRHAYRRAYPEPFTIDLVVTELVSGARTERAASVKTPQDAADPEVRQRLAVEHAWCHEHSMPWALVDTSAFNKQLLDNLRFMRAWFRNHYESEHESALRFALAFEDSYRTNVPLNALIHRTGRKLRLANAVAENQFRYCAWYDMIPVSLRARLSMSDPLVLRRSRDRA